MAEAKDPHQKYKFLQNLQRPIVNTELSWNKQQGQFINGSFRSCEVIEQDDFTNIHFQSLSESDQNFLTYDLQIAAESIDTSQNLIDRSPAQPTAYNLARIIDSSTLKRSPQIYDNSTASLRLTDIKTGDELFVKFDSVSEEVHVFNLNAKLSEESQYVYKTTDSGYNELVNSMLKQVKFYE